MNIEHITQEIMTFAGTFNIWLVISLFLLCLINEFGLSIPYLMEAVWILVGYHALSGSIPAYQVVLLWMSAVSGRLAGAFILFKLLGLGSTWIMKIYRKLFGSFLADNKAQDNNSWPRRLMRRINLFSPFSVALGRLLWLKIPLTLILSIRKEPRTLLLAIVISSAIWETTYIVVGLIGGNTRLAPGWFVLYSMGALTVIYTVFFLIQRVIKMTQNHALK
jgi:membrane-associated protein